jgi:hypothetical protein
MPASELNQLPNFAHHLGFEFSITHNNRFTTTGFNQ